METFRSCLVHIHNITDLLKLHVHLRGSSFEEIPNLRLRECKFPSHYVNTAVNTQQIHPRNCCRSDMQTSLDPNFYFWHTSAHPSRNIAHSHATNLYFSYSSHSVRSRCGHNVNKYIRNTNINRIVKVLFELDVNFFVRCKVVFFYMYKCV